MTLTLLLAALVGIPILEIYLVVGVAHAVGAPLTAALLLATSLAGAWLLRHQGTRAWHAFTQAFAEHRPPHREITDATLVLLGGALMLAPGFATDAAGLLLCPPSRTVARRLLLATAARRATTAGVLRVRSHRGPARPADRPGRNTVIEGEIVDRTAPHGGETDRPA